MPAPDNIPGTDDDEWDGSANMSNQGLTDDYITNDIMYVVFEYPSGLPAERLDRCSRRSTATRAPAAR